jgi:hypothetical protein
MDHHVRQEITDGLRDRGVDVLTAVEDGANRLPDDQLLDRATELGRVLFTQDRHLLQEAARRQRMGREFSGVVYGHQERLTVGQYIAELEYLGLVGQPEDCEDRVTYLPL